MDKKKALSKAMNLCSRKEYCILEITDKLFNWFVSEHDISKILEYLIEEKFIDETRYIKHYINDKIWLNKWGKRKVKYALKIKNVNPDIVQNELNKIDKEKYIMLITKELERKLKSIQGNENMKIKAKLFNFGTARGYEPDYLYKISENLIGGSN